MSTAVRWEVSNAYFSASSVDTHIFAGHLKGDMDTNDAIFYSFEDDFGRDQTISSGTNGQQIGRTYPWVEDGACIDGGRRRLDADRPDPVMG